MGSWRADVGQVKGRPIAPRPELVEEPRQGPLAGERIASIEPVAAQEGGLELLQRLDHARLVHPIDTRQAPSASGGAQPTRSRRHAVEPGALITGVAESGVFFDHPPQPSSHHVSTGL